MDSAPRALDSTGSRRRLPSQTFSAAPSPSTASSAPRSGVALTTLALTFLNPHVYLDTVLMLGTIASGHGPVGRWWFAAGAMAGSILWFSLLGLGARALAPHLARPAVWRVLDVLIGVMMLVIAALLMLR